MLFNKIESKNDKILVLVHGGNSSPREWDKYIPYLKDKFTLYIITLSGHGEDYNNPFTSIKDNAESIYNILSKDYVKSIYLYGRGLGAQVSLKFIEMYPNFVNKVIFESLSCIQIGYYRHFLKAGALLKYKDDDEDIKKHLKLSKKQFKKMLTENLNFYINLEATNYKNEALVLYARFDDDYIKKSAEQIKNFIEKVTVKEIDGLHNFGVEKVEDVVQIINEFMK